MLRLDEEHIEAQKHIILRTKDDKSEISPEELVTDVEENEDDDYSED